MFGVPVIANNVGGIPEALGSSGILMDVNLAESVDIDHLAGQYAIQVQRLLNDETLYQDYSHRALSRAREFDQQQEDLVKKIFIELIQPRVQ